MPVLSLACHLPHNTPNIPSRYNNEQTTKQTKAINNSYIYIYISCKCDTNRAGHFTLDAYASRPVACLLFMYSDLHRDCKPSASETRPYRAAAGETVHWTNWTSQQTLAVNLSWRMEYVRYKMTINIPRLTHWGRVTHICVNKLTVIGSDNGLLPDRRQAIIWTNAGILLIGTLEQTSVKF